MTRRAFRKHHAFLLILLSILAFCLPSLAGEGWMMFESLAEASYLQVKEGYQAPFYPGEPLSFPADLNLDINQQGSLEIEVPQDGLYEIWLHYRNTKTSMLPTELTLSINGSSPFYECKRIKLHSRWADESGYAKDRYGNQIAPFPVMQNVVLEAGITDSAGRVADPFLFELQTGKNHLTFAVTEGSVHIKELRLQAPETLAAYAGQPATGSALIILEGEQMAWRNRSSIRGSGEYNASLSPYDSSARLINFLDGCALSLPCHARGDAPVGLTLAAAGGRDRAVLALGLGVERALSGVTGLDTPL